MALIRGLAVAVALALLAGCHSLAVHPGVRATLDRLLPAQVLMLGEQHDAPEHQQWQARIVAHLAARGELAALVLEMAPQGGSTAPLDAAASEEQVRRALRWDDRAWPWTAYGPAVMAAVRAGVPVLGGNLPMEQMRQRMRDTQLDERLPAAELQRQRDLVRDGHCQLLPEAQIAPMTRIQIARDLSMAQTIASALPQARPGQVVVLITGSVHADKRLGVPVHLPAGVTSASLRLQAGDRGIAGESFDQVLQTPPAPAVDHCAGLAEQLKGRGKP